MSELPVDVPPTISSYVDQALISELSRSFAEAHGIGVHIFDSNGQVITQLDGGQTIWTALRNSPEARQTVDRFMNGLRQTPLGMDEFKISRPQIGPLTFLSLALIYESQAMGTVVIGPFCQKADPSCEKESYHNAMTLEGLAEHMSTLPKVDPEYLIRHARVLKKSLEVSCHLGYRALMTGHIHVDSMAEAYRKLEEANEGLEARNAALAANVARLRELDVLKSNFLATVSHELRTPLTSVIGYSEMLLEGLAGPMNDEQTDYVKTIMERGESLLALIGNILDISRIQRGGVSLNLEYVSVEDLIESALASVRPQAFKKSIELIEQLEEHLPEVQVDEQKIHQVLVNLLGNAVKFTDASGTVSLFVRRCMMPSTSSPTGQVASGIEFEVKDTGIGIPPALLGRIFDAFYQVDNSPTRRYGGAGLGLSIVRNVVQAHGGRIQVQSKLNIGTRVIVTIPMTQSITSTPHS